MLCESGKLANEKNLKICVGLQRRHEPQYTQGIQEISNGKYGKVLGLLGNWNRGRYCLRTRHPDATEMAHQVRAWNHFTGLSGDHISEQNVAQHRRLRGMTAVLGYLAAYSGKVVKWDEAVEKGPALMIYENHDQLTFDSLPPVLPNERGEYPVPVPGVWKPW